MAKYFPMAAVDVETAKYYSRDDMATDKLSSLMCGNKLSDIISLAIVWID
jgi:hypothetical protein